MAEFNHTSERQPLFNSNVPLTPYRIEPVGELAVVPLALIGIAISQSGPFSKAPDWFCTTEA